MSVKMTLPAGTELELESPVINDGVQQYLKKVIGRGEALTPEFAEACRQELVALRVRHAIACDKVLGLEKKIADAKARVESLEREIANQRRTADPEDIPIGKWTTRT